MELIYLSKMELKMKNRTYITKQWNIKLFELKLEEEKIKKKKSILIWIDKKNKIYIIN